LRVGKEREGRRGKERKEMDGRDMGEIHCRNTASVAKLENWWSCTVTVSR